MSISQQDLNKQYNWDKQSQQQQELEEIFGFFKQNDQPIVKAKPNQQSAVQFSAIYNKQFNQNYDFDQENKLYEGCYNEQQYQNQFCQQKIDNHQESIIEFQSQPIAYDSYKFGKNSLKRVRDRTDFTYSQNIKNQRSLNALVSAKKRPKQKSNDNKSVNNDSSSSNTTKNSKFQFKKNTNVNNHEKDQPIFINPFTTSPLETMNLEKFTKLNKLNYEQLLQRVEILYNKMMIYGEKTFFKSKQNQEEVNQILVSTGLKVSQKLGKSKTFREFKAIYKYLKLINPEKPQQDNILTGIKLLDSTYLTQFKQLMGYETSKKNNLPRAREEGSLLEFGFSASKIKK